MYSCYFRSHTPASLTRSQFYLSPEQLGKPRAGSVFEKLRELNPRIELKVPTVDRSIDRFALRLLTLAYSSSPAQ